MSVESYLGALRNTARLPATIVDGALAFESLDPDEAVEPDELRALEASIEEFERFADDQPLETLADRSVLTLGGLANLRVGARVWGAAEGVEADGGLEAILAGEDTEHTQRVAQLMLVDPDIENMIEAIRRAENYSPTQSKDPHVDEADSLTDLEDKLGEHVDSLLDTGDKAIRDLAKVVAWGKVGDAILAASKRSEMLQSIQRGLKSLRRLALRAMDAGFRALERVLGASALGRLVAEAKDRFEDLINKAKDEDGGVVASVLGRLMGADAVTAQCAQIVRDAGGTATAVAAALSAAKSVSDHASGLAQVSDKVTDVVALAGPWLWRPPVAPYAAAGFVVAIAGVVWQLQDHLDAQSPFRLPDVTEGMIASVRAAVIL